MIPIFQRNQHFRKVLVNITYTDVQEQKKKKKKNDAAATFR